MPRPSRQNLEDTRQPILFPASRGHVTRYLLGISLTVLGIVFLLISLILPWLATTPTPSGRSVAGASTYSPLALVLNPNGLIIWMSVYLLALLSAVILSIALLWTTWHSASPIGGTLGWITVSCGIGVVTTLFLTYLPRFTLSFDYSSSRTDLGPGFFAVLGGYAMVFLGSMTAHVGRPQR